MNLFDAATLITITLASVITWWVIIILLVKIDLRVAELRTSKLVTVYFFNQVCAFMLAIVQFYFLNWITNFFTGFGFGYGIAAAAIIYCCGAIPVAIFSTFRFHRELRKAS